VISENDRRSARADRRLVGVDLGIASDHTVRVLRGDGSEVCRRRACPTVESLTRLETAALVGAPVGTRLEVVIEPTGPAWLPVAVFFTSRGHRVFRVASAKAADLRRFRPGTPRATASTPTPSPGCRCWHRAACSRWSCPGARPPPWTGGSGRATG